MSVAEQSHEGPTTATERRVAVAWAQVLGIPEEQIDRRNNFFDLGGTSLSVIKLAIALNRAVSFKDLAAHPILADQAELIDRRLERGVPADLVHVESDRSAATRETAARRVEGRR